MNWPHKSWKGHIKWFNFDVKNANAQSDIQLLDKHFRKNYCRNGVVDHLGQLTFHHLQFQFQLWDQVLLGVCKQDISQDMVLNETCFYSILFFGAFFSLLDSKTRRKLDISTSWLQSYERLTLQCKIFGNVIMSLGHRKAYCIDKGKNCVLHHSFWSSQPAEKVNRAETGKFNFACGFLKF